MNTDTRNTKMFVAGQTCQHLTQKHFCKVNIRSYIVFQHDYHVYDY